MEQARRPPIVVRYAVAAPRVSWELGEETMPESLLHDQAVELLKAVLSAWARRSGESLLVARNLAVRWDEANPTFGLDPDVCVLSPAPPTTADANLRSVRTWLEGHSAPALAIEVVSETNAHKDYRIVPDKYAASGTGELVIFDPLLSGPPSYGGPFRLQLWHRDDDGGFSRVYAGDGPVWSETLSAHFVAVDDGHKLRLANDAAAKELWLTAEEAALARVAELEAQVARRDTGPPR